MDKWSQSQLGELWCETVAVVKHIKPDSDGDGSGRQHRTTRDSCTKYELDFEGKQCADADVSQIVFLFDREVLWNTRTADVSDLCAQLATEWNVDCDPSLVRSYRDRTYGLESVVEGITIPIADLESNIESHFSFMLILNRPFRRLSSDWRFEGCSTGDHANVETIDDRGGRTFSVCRRLRRLIDPDYYLCVVLANDCAALNTEEILRDAEETPSFERRITDAGISGRGPLEILDEFVGLSILFDRLFRIHRRECCAKSLTPLGLSETQPAPEILPPAPKPSCRKNDLRPKSIVPAAQNYSRGGVAVLERELELFSAGSCEDPEELKLLGSTKFMFIVILWVKLPRSKRNLRQRLRHRSLRARPRGVVDELIRVVEDGVLCWQKISWVKHGSLHGAGMAKVVLAGWEELSKNTGRVVLGQEK
ncbi:hypothetical protein BJ742DRAFT_746055 [Cladochytrium replicatum]|nr:hypothetical protein BJ742DRAFT_746055 [Cladochytrium replicatum]